MDGSLLICSAQIYVNALNTMHSLWSVTQSGYCAVPRHEERKSHGPLWSGSAPWRGYQLAVSAEWCDLIIPIAYEPSEKQRNLLRARSRTNYPMILCLALNTETFEGSDWMSCVVLVWISLKENQKPPWRHFSQAERKSHENFTSYKVGTNRDLKCRA